MSKENIELTRTDLSGLSVRSIVSSDLEDLRYWKNRNKEFFFLRSEITQEQQEAWYEKFLQRADDHMFIAGEYINDLFTTAGCMGFRLLSDENTIDAYNIMRFNRTENGRYSMEDLFKTMLKYASDSYPGFSISVKVLKNNPAISWYTDKIGFRLVNEKDTWNYYELDQSALAGILISAYKR